MQWTQKQVQEHMKQQQVDQDSKQKEVEQNLKKMLGVPGQAESEPHSHTPPAVGKHQVVADAAEAARSNPPNQAARFCPYCGGGLKQHYKFCQFCGESVPAGIWNP